MRKTFIKILLVLVISAAALLLAVGTAVYYELSRQLTYTGESTLKAESEEINAAVQSVADGSGADRPYRFSDDRGQNVFFYATSGKVQVESDAQPLPPRLLLTDTPPMAFFIVHNHHKPYRIYHYQATIDNKTFKIFIYTMIFQEKDMLARVSRVMWIVGTAGFILALVGNLLLAERVLRPARKTWEAYQKSVLQLSHELQTPLATVGAMLVNRRVEPVTRADIQRELDRASRMVTDILYLSKVRAKSVEIEREPVAVSDITEEVVERMQKMAEDEHIHIEGTLEPGVYVITTVDRWERIISTVFKNVLDHAKRPSTATWSLTVQEDNVIFIQENEMNGEILSRTRNRARGVGMQIVRELVLDMHGTLDITAKGGIYRLAIRVPRVRAD